MCTSYTVSRTNSVYSLSFLRNWRMQSYSGIITCSIVASLVPNGFLTPNGLKFYNKIHINCYFVKLQTLFSQDLLFIGCDIFPQVMVICLHLRFRRLLWNVKLLFLTYVLSSKNLNFCHILSHPTVIQSTRFW